MDKPIESPSKVDKQAEYQSEFIKLTTIFSDVEESKRKLVGGMIEDAAYLFAENKALRALLAVTGMVRINPSNPTQQKPIEAAKQYRQNAAAYAVIIKTLNGVLNKNIPEEEDDMGDFE
jgi:hypothetical protein